MGLAIVVVSSTPLGAQPVPLAIDDARLAPLLRAAEQFDRKRHGFTPLPTGGPMSLDGTASDGRYDAMLHCTDRPYRTIAFRREGVGYRWVGEQQSFDGPRVDKTVDGLLRESITLTYDIEPVSGAPVHRLHVSYWGLNDPFGGVDEPGVEDARRVLRAWGYRHP